MEIGSEELGDEVDILERGDEDVAERDDLRIREYAEHLLEPSTRIRWEGEKRFLTQHSHV